MGMDFVPASSGAPSSLCTNFKPLVSAPNEAVVQILLEQACLVKLVEQIGHGENLVAASGSISHQLLRAIGAVRDQLPYRHGGDVIKDAVLHTARSQEKLPFARLIGEIAAKTDRLAGRQSRLHMFVDDALDAGPKRFDRVKETLGHDAVAERPALAARH